MFYEAGPKRHWWVALQDWWDPVFLELPMLGTKSQDITTFAAQIVTGLMYSFIYLSVVRPKDTGATFESLHVQYIQQY